MHRSTFLPLHHAATLIFSVDWGLQSVHQSVDFSLVFGGFRHRVGAFGFQDACNMTADCFPLVRPAHQEFAIVRAVSTL